MIWCRGARSCLREPDVAVPSGVVVNAVVTKGSALQSKGDGGQIKEMLL
jgi:hypothetical protein